MLDVPVAMPDMLYVIYVLYGKLSVLWAQYDLCALCAPYYSPLATRYYSALVVTTQRCSVTLLSTIQRYWMHSPFASLRARRRSEKL